MHFLRRAAISLFLPIDSLMDRMAPGAFDSLRPAVLGAGFPDFFDRTRSVFIHVPKAAGFSISVSLYGQPNEHFTWKEWRRLHPRKFDAYFKFALVRDPFDRFVSAFRFLKVGGMYAWDREFAEQTLAPFAEPGELAEAMVNRPTRQAVLKWLHFRPQCEFVADARGNLKVDALFSFERLAESFEEIKNRISPNCTLPHLNKTIAPATRPLSARAVQVLKSVYATDFRLCALAAGKNLATMKPEPVAPIGVRA